MASTISISQSQRRQANGTLRNWAGGDGRNMNLEIISFIKAALECSVFVAPLEPGLTYEELVEIGRRAGDQPGELGDALPHATTRRWGQKSLLPDAMTLASWQFITREDPEYRNIDAFDFVVAALISLAKAEGAALARLQRNVVVERAVAQLIPRHDIELAITYQVMANMLAEKDGVLSFPDGHVRGFPSDQLRNQPAYITNKPLRARAYPIVKDIVERRSDGRPKHAEPLDAFADELDKLSYGSFRLWWRQAVAELRQADPNAAPVSTCVLAAALVEGA